MVGMFDEITSAIPHRSPMLLVDEIVGRTEDAIVCRKTFHEEEFFLQGHYPDKPIVPGVILCESAMQAGAILLSKFVEEQEGVPVVTRMNDVKFKRMVTPGDTIEMSVKLNERLAAAFFMKARVTCDEKLAARFEFVCALVAK